MCWLQVIPACCLGASFGSRSVHCPPSPPSDLSEELRKPIILNKMLDPEGGRKLASIASVLAQEPDVGSEAPIIKITDDDVLATSADIKLLNDGNSADKMRFNEKG